jgi:tRNA(fMet)-specific endonuclease VapC
MGEHGEDPPPQAALAVVDTGIVSALLVGTQRAREAEILSRYDVHLRGKSLILSFASVAELRFGALSGNWGSTRRKRMEDWFSEVATIVMPDNDLVTICARLRDKCRHQGHALNQKIHDSDRWIASTAIRHGIPLISDDKVFQQAPDLVLVQQPLGLAQHS